MCLCLWSSEKCPKVVEGVWKFIETRLEVETATRSSVLPRASGDVYAVGWSNGAFLLTEDAAAERPVFQAIAPIAGHVERESAHSYFLS